MSDFEGARSARMRASRYLKGRDSNSPTLSSCHSEKSLWARSYKNQPIPASFRSRMLGKKYQLSQSSCSDEEIIAVLEEEENQAIEKKKTRLSKFKVISDRGQFSDTRKSIIQTERKTILSPQRCRSVSSLKLPQVLEQKRQDDELKKKGLSKLTEFRDNNQFNYIKKRGSMSQLSDGNSGVESMQMQNTQLKGILPEEILQNDAQETKSCKMINEKTGIEAELQKIIVDEVDEKRRKKEQMSDSIESIIEQQKHEEQVDTHKLSQLLSKFQSQSSYLTNINDAEDFSRKNDNYVGEISNQKLIN